MLPLKDQNQIFTYSSVLHSHTVVMKLCPCGRYNSVLYPNNHILKPSKIIFNGLVLKDFESKLSLKVGKPRLYCFFLQNSTQIPSLESFIIIYVCQFLKLLIS